MWHFGLLLGKKRAELRDLKKKKSRGWRWRSSLILHLKICSYSWCGSNYSLKNPTEWSVVAPVHILVKYAMQCKKTNMLQTFIFLVIYSVIELNRPLWRRGSEFVTAVVHRSWLINVPKYHCFFYGSVEENSVGWWHTPVLRGGRFESSQSVYMFTKQFLIKTFFFQSQTQMFSLV